MIIKQRKILFISVDGVQNYLESLFLPVLEKLCNESNNVKVLEFCLRDSHVYNEYKHKKYKNKIKIYFSHYFNKPPIIGPFFFIFYGAFKLFIMIKKEKIDLLMPRSLLAGAMVLLIKPFVKDIKIIFETDGLLADERVEFSSWSENGFLYKLLRKIETKLITDSIYVTTRTSKAKEILMNRSKEKDRNKFIVIPNAKNIIMPFKEERKKIRNALNIEETDFVFIYVGTIGKQYEPDLMMQIFNSVYNYNHNVKFLVLTPNQREIKHIVSKYKDIEPNIVTMHVNADDVYKYIISADIGFALRTPSFSQQAISPIKLIEYMLIGLPIISNSGVGDLDKFYAKYNIGYIINDFKNIDYRAINKYIENIILEDKGSRSLNIQNIAKKEFDFEDIINTYDTMIDKVFNGSK